ncbi:hypothetical protein A33I_05390 [Alkalihalophilus marmarensis DSM 21297]|uniref:Uncharacterized protein n=1 Tax=Alkalihalophilus marmarensis DSM 21297 TaxID=1188261 RepID=U6SSU6_9BACI|nr:hypothetical protein A33I_05390 [Alkalihalophilus marmarensis DSM 21297]
MDSNYMGITSLYQEKRFKRGISQIRLFYQSCLRSYNSVGLKALQKQAVQMQDEDFSKFI